MAAQKFGLTVKKEDNFSEWYQQVVLKSELLDYYDIRGCFIMRPSSMYMWKAIRKYFDYYIEKMGVEECYFPMLVSKKNLEMEKDHLENFNPELAWITKCGDKEIEEPVAIRPTSETIMYPAFARWLQSYRDLPLKLNQWCSVLRWEVKSTLPFIRGREFLWQEGHTAYHKKEEAETEVMEILDLYARIYSDLLAVPVVKGRKSRKETFGGAEYTLSLEAFIPFNGKGVQAATSHHLGTNFAKMFNIVVEDDNKSLVHQNCWGFTTRSLGICTMLHSDNLGFVCPPFVSAIQVVVLMCGIKATTSDEEKEKLSKYATKIFNKIKENNIRVHFDDRDHVSPGYKFNHYELRGVPLRVEVGFKDLEKNEFCLVFRHNMKKRQIAVENISDIQGCLQEMHDDLYKKALEEQKSKTVICEEFGKMLVALNNKNIVLAPWCGDIKCEDEIGEKTTMKEGNEVVLMGAKSLCVPFDAPSHSGKKCISCVKDSSCFALFGRSY